MKKYEELFNHSKYIFDEESARFTRVEDKAAKSITVITSLLAVYALTGRQIFGDLLPVSSCVDKLLVVLASLVLLGLFISWIFAFRALQIQGLKKAPLNDKVLSFYNDENLVDIYYAMSKNFSDSLPYNRNITDAKATNIKRSHWCTVATVVFFILFIVFFAINKNMQLGVKANELRASTATIHNKGAIKMSEESNSTDTEATQAQIVKPDTTSVKPNTNITAPEFELVTESFDPSKLNSNQKAK